MVNRVDNVKCVLFLKKFGSVLLLMCRDFSSDISMCLLKSWRAKCLVLMPIILEIARANMALPSEFSRAHPAWYQYEGLLEANILAPARIPVFLALFVKQT